MRCGSLPGADEGGRLNGGRPVIGVTGARGRGWAMWAFTALSLRLQGARPRRIAPPLDDAAFDGLDGLVIGGGDHISATLYGGEPMPEIEIDAERDALEMAALRRLWDAPVPILGICRGAQLMNAYRGGRLHQDVWAEYPNARRVRTPLPLKRLRTCKGAALAGHLGREAFRANALHDQAISEPGDGLRVAARDENAIVQAVEAEGARFRVGVQWHPEFLVYRRPHRRLFRAFVRAAGLSREPASRTAEAAR
jgi:putative glutamine amidotransferase